MGTVNWRKDLDQALDEAKSNDKPVFLDVFNPEWIGCQQMDAVTYPKQNVIDMLEKHVIPVRTPFDGDVAKEFEAKWTPFLLFLDTNKKGHHTVVGFLPPEELIPAIFVGVGKTFFDAGELDRAMGALDNVIKNHPSSHAAPEAVYFRGVCEYKKTHSAEPLKQVYEKLQAEYPANEWATRADPYRLL